MNKSIKSKTLKFKYKNGQTSTGKDKFSYNNIPNIDTAVSDDILFGMLAVIVKVQKVQSENVEVAEISVMQ